MLPIIGGLAGAAGSYADWKAGETGRDAQKWSLGQRQDLSNMFQGQMGQGGINPQLMQQLMARFQQSTQPMQNQLSARMAQFGTGPGSGEMARMFNNQMAPMLAGYQGQLGMQDVQMRQSHDDNIRQLLARLS